MRKISVNFIYLLIFMIIFTITYSLFSLLGNKTPTPLAVYSAMIIAIFIGIPIYKKLGSKQEQREKHTYMVIFTIIYSLFMIISNKTPTPIFVYFAMIIASFVVIPIYSKLESK